MSFNKSSQSGRKTGKPLGGQTAIRVRLGDFSAMCSHAVVDERIGDLAFVERTFSSLEVAWSAQCLCESNKSSLYRKLVKSAKAEE